jgi:CHAT domain-containing protein
MTQAEAIPQLESVANTAHPALQQGLALYEKGNFAAAAQQWTEALQAFQQTNRWRDAALAHNYLALAYQQLGQYTSAQASLTQGLQLLSSKSSDQSTEAILARLLNTQGSLDLTQGKPAVALENWQKAAQVYHTLGDRGGEVGSLINQAQAEQALGYFLRARNTLTQAEERIPSQIESPLQLTLALNLGQVLAHIGEFDRAKAVLTKAEAIAQQRQLSEQAAATLIQQGNLAYVQQQWADSLTAYEQALTFSDHPQIQLDANLNRLRVFTAQRQWAKAQALIPALTDTLAQLPTNHKSLLQRLQLADSLMTLYSATQNPPLINIVPLLTQARQQAKQLQDLRLESFAVGYLGHLYERSQQWSAAETTTRQALAFAQLANAEDSCYRWKWQLGRIFRAQGQLKPALAAYQESINILQSLRQGLVHISADLQYSFRDQVEPVYREYVDLLLQPNAGQDLPPDTLKKAQQAIESLRLAELSYFLRSTCLETQRRFAQPLATPDTALLYPIVLSDRLVTLVSLPDGSLRLFSYNVAAPKLESLVQQLRVALEKPYTAPEGKALGFELYRWLIEPAEPLLTQAKVKTLVFVPDGALSNLPLAALHDGQRFLVERYSIAIAPSLQLVAAEQRVSDRTRTLAAGLSDSRAGFAPLAFVPEELKAVVQNRPGQILLNEKFTSRAISNAVENSAITVMHLATHGQFSSNMDQTFILAWDKPLTLYDLKALIEKRQNPFRKAIDLLVLSACETAAGDNRAALGLAGVAVQSGTRSTVATLWTVDDESSSLFMQNFYAALAQPGATKANALRQAQLKLLSHPDYRHPFHWAAYVLVGSWR